MNATASTPAVPIGRLDRTAYFLDIDGTLFDIMPSPDQVTVDRDVIQLLDRLRRESGGALAVISGRTLADIDRIFDCAPFAAAGQHGAEWRDADGHVTRPGRDPALDAAYQALQRAVADHPGLLVEDKGASLAAHYRLAPDLEDFVARIMQEAQHSVGPAYRVHTGKKIAELGPVGRDKGTAIRTLMTLSPFSGRHPVFLGDDVTDEDGFAAVIALGGDAIKVGPGPSAAPWRLADVHAVREWLERNLAPVHRRSA